MPLSSCVCYIMGVAYPSQVRGIQIYECIKDVYGVLSVGCKHGEVDQKCALVY